MYIQVVFTCKVSIKYIGYYFYVPYIYASIYCSNFPFLCRWISCKEIAFTSIEKMIILAIETVCMIESTFPTSILTIQVHTLVHIVDEVALTGVVNTHACICMCACTCMNGELLCVQSCLCVCV